MIQAILGNGHLGGVDIALTRRFQLDLPLVFLCIAQNQHSVFQRLISLDLQFGDGAFDRPQVAAWILGLIRQTRPAWIVIGHAKLGHVGQIDDSKVERLGLHRSRLDVILD